LEAESVHPKPIVSSAADTDPGVIDIDSECHDADCAVHEADSADQGVEGSAHDFDQLAVAVD
jgi:hypothetical protein